MNDTLDQAHRELSKWLNEEQLKPIDIVALATVLAAVAPERAVGLDHIRTSTPPDRSSAMTDAEYQRMIENGKAWQLVDAQTLRDGGPPDQITDTDILALAHRMAWRYTHSTQPSCIEYTFDNVTLLDFVRAAKGLK